MDVRIDAAHGPVEASLGEQDVCFHVARRRVVIHWSDIVGAGLARAPKGPTHLPQDVVESLPGGPRRVDVIPFGSRLLDRIDRLKATHRAVVVAYGSGKAFQVFAPTDDPGTQQLVDEFRTRLGERWLDGDWELMDLRKRLGIRVGWRGRAVGIAFVVVVGIGGLLAVAGWAGLLRAWGEGDFSLLRPYTLVPLALWCAFVWYALRRLRS
jgi:hypothetical protein